MEPKEKDETKPQKLSTNFSTATTRKQISFIISCINNENENWERELRMKTEKKSSKIANPLPDEGNFSYKI